MANDPDDIGKPDHEVERIAQERQRGSSRGKDGLAFVEQAQVGKRTPSAGKKSGAGKAS